MLCDPLILQFKWCQTDEFEVFQGYETTVASLFYMTRDVGSVVMFWRPLLQSEGTYTVAVVFQDDTIFYSQ